jgi:hypothetical protein
LDVASGEVIADITERHRADKFRQFLNLINRSVPEQLEVHLVVDKVSTYKSLHFTPIYSSWINLVERRFAELTTKWMRRGRIARPKSSRWISPPGSTGGTSILSRSSGTRG